MPVGWRRDMVPSVTNDHGLIDLTSATEDDLCRLVGVGPALASQLRVAG